MNLPVDLDGAAGTAVTWRVVVIVKSRKWTAA
jgi:hypothetical protein